jgi:hypothetical protein
MNGQTGFVVKLKAGKNSIEKIINRGTNLWENQRY